MREQSAARVERFVAAFQSFWSNPAPHRMGELLTEDAVLVQPLAEPMVGLEAAQEEFGRLFSWLPDLRAQVDHWAYRDGALLIEFTLSATLKGERVEWPVVDRFTLRGDLASRRVTYFDPLPLLARVVQKPSAWWGWWRSGAARPWAGSLGVEATGE